MKARAPLLTALFASLAIVLAASCQRYEPPPTPQVLGLAGNVLPDPKAPLAIWFGKPIDPATLKVQVAYFDSNLEGELPDEDSDPDTELRTVIRHDLDEGDRGGRFELNAAGDVGYLIPDGAFPVGPKLALIVEPGLRATDGRERTNRTVIPFTYAVRCNGGTTGKLMPSGTYFALLEVEQPLGTQIQLLGVFDVDPATGQLIGQFTNADRNPDKTRCPTPCGANDVCRLLPTPACVAPSTRAGTVDERSDFVPNTTPPTGYSFAISGCAVDDANGKGAGVVTFPATMIVESPPVTVGGLEMVAFFGPDANGTVRASGTLTAQAVSLGGNLIGPGKGTMSAILIPEAEVPPGVPRPPKLESDAGTP